MNDSKNSMKQTRKIKSNKYRGGGKGKDETKKRRENSKEEKDISKSS